MPQQRPDRSIAVPRLICANANSEEQGVIAEGTFGPDGDFATDSVFAKHDERCMTKEVARGLKTKGVWQESASK